jgi:O-antigen/teichoic acid export membrane protein
MATARLVRWTGGLLAAAVIARSLGPAGFGEFSAAMWATTTAGVLAIYGFSSSGVRFVARSLTAGDGSASSMVRFMFGRTIPVAGLAVSGILVLVLLRLAGVSFGAAPLPLLIGAVGVPFLAWVGLAAAVLIGSQGYLALAVVQVAQVAALVTMTTLIALSPLRPDASWFVAGSVGAAIIGAVASLAALHRRRLLHKGPPLDPATKSEILRYSRTLFILVLAEIVVWQRSEIVVLGLTRPAAELGLYAASYALVSGLMDAFPRALGITYFPALSGQASPEFRQTLHRAVPAVGLIGAVLAAGLVGGGGQALEAIYGAGYAAAAASVAILACAGAVGAVGGLAASALYAKDRQSHVLGVTIVGAVVNIGADILLIPGYGLVGAAMANGVGQVLVTGLLLGTLLLRGEMAYGTVLPLGRLVSSAAVGSAVGLSLPGVMDPRLPHVFVAGVAALAAAATTLVVVQVLGGNLRSMAGSILRSTD